MFLDSDHIPETRCQVAILLTRPGRDRRWLAERVEFDLGGAKCATVFASPLGLEDGFAAEFAAALAEFLAEADLAEGFSDPTLVFRLPQVVLGGMQVFPVAAVADEQAVMLCFRRAIGRLQSLMVPRLRCDGSTMVALERAAADALLNLLRPCLDLAAVEPVAVEAPSVTRQIRQRLEILSEKKDDLTFFSYLLRRYVENAPEPEVHPAQGPPSVAVAAKAEAS